MIARLAGTLVDRDGTEIIIDCGGVGYEVTCSAYTLAAMPALGERVVLKIFTHALESKLTLYGFIDAAERAVFDLLIKVKNVGPSTATSILSGSAPRDIATLIAREDLHGLTRIKGVGKKTGEMLIVELREKCEMLLLTWNADGNVRTVAQPAGAIRTGFAGRRHPLLEEVASALAAMGWRPNEADAAVADLAVVDGATLESLLRQALRNMPR
jgi:holliday junction DNA helicase RuvA